MEITNEILYNLTIAYKNNQISDIQELNPLKTFVYRLMPIFNCQLNYEDRQDIYSSFLCRIWKTKKNPVEKWINKYLRTKVIDVMRENGYIKDERCRINQQIRPDFYLDNIPDIQKSIPFIAKDCFL